MRRRSRSEAPPHTPCSMWFSSAYSRHGPFTGHSAQYRRATSTPTPSLGKKISGGRSRQRPRTIQEVSISTSISASPQEPAWPQVLQLNLVTSIYGTDALNGLTSSPWLRLPSLTLGSLSRQRQLTARSRLDKPRLGERAWVPEMDKAAPQSLVLSP